MDDLKLYLDRFRSNEYKDFSLISSPEILENAEKEAFYEDPIHIEGTATIANDHFIVDITIKTNIKVFCKICNEMLVIPFNYAQKHGAFSLEKIKSGIFCLEAYVRDLVFLHTPRYKECNDNCPEREVIKNYLKKNDP